MRSALMTLLLIMLMTGHGFAGDLATDVDRYLAPYLETANFSGSVLIGRKGRILLARSYGMASIEDAVPNTVDTTFRLASVSRVFTSAAILLLEQRGLLSVDDRLSSHLPDWPRGDEITIHQLLTLSAGFPNINTLPGYPLWEQSPQTPESLVSKFRDLPLEFEPGTRSVHSNSNYNVLALIIENVSGKPYGEFLKSEMFAPVGMRHSGHAADMNREFTANATGYRPVGFADLEPDRTIDWSVKTGNGSLYSTAGDVYRFDRALVEGRLLKKTAVAKLFAGYFPGNGYGWFLNKPGEDPRVLINGRSPGFGAYWIRDIRSDVTVIVLGNIYNSAPTTIGNALLDLALGKPVDPLPITTAKPDARMLARIAGSYQFGPKFYRPNALKIFKVRDGHLFDNGAWVMPVDKSGRRFIHRTYWSTLEFRQDDSGRIIDVLYDDYVGVRRQGKQLPGSDSDSGL